MIIGIRDNNLQGEITTVDILLKGGEVIGVITTGEEEGQVVVTMIIGEGDMMTGGIMTTGDIKEATRDTRSEGKDPDHQATNLVVVLEAGDHLI